MAFLLTGTAPSCKKELTLEGKLVGTWFGEGIVNFSGNLCNDWSLDISTVEDKLHFSFFNDINTYQVDLLNDTEFRVHANGCYPFTVCELTGELIGENQLEVVKSIFTLSASGDHQNYKDCDFIMIRQ